MTIEKIQESLTTGKLQRRHIRNSLFRIRSGDVEDREELKKYIETQFTEIMNWSNFTFDWDVGVTDPLKVIRKLEWVENGGKFGLFGFEPPAFTGQE
jgi:hypothetical protein